jgi:uncharacterized Zn-binding protein involved in type VI secretion
MPAVSRAGDTVLSIDGTGYKCRQPMETSVGEVNSNNVFANGILIVIQGKKVAPHPKGGCVPDESALTAGSSTVKIGGKGMGRIGDDYGGINTITQGSPNVFAGG